MERNVRKNINNPYEMLKIREGASDEEIKAAYKELVKKYHPDRYQNNPLADATAPERQLTRPTPMVCK